jgi:signal transduction histidine kinase
MPPTPQQRPVIRFDTDPTLSCLGRLLERAARLDRGAALEPSLGSLLEPLAELERGGMAGLRIEVGGTELVIQRGGESGESGEGVRTALSSGFVPASRAPAFDPLFPMCPGERAVALPPPEKGSLHLAAPALERGSPSGYDGMLAEAALVIALCVRALRAESAEREEDQRLRQLEKLATIGQTASQVVHELNNPLTAILAYSDYLTKRFRDRGIADADCDRLMRIHEAATRIQRFCRDLTDYSRPESSLRGPVDVHAVIDRALGFCMHGLRAAEITVERVYRDIPSVLGMDSSLTQVFVNLFTNAWHAMDDRGGTLGIRTRAAADSVTVEVMDEGHGIDAAHLERMFDPYFTTKPRGRGVGLGLSIVKQIVAEHGGSISAHNREPRGAVFVVVLPIKGH